MIAGSDLASSRSFLALSGFMLNSLATCSTLFSSIIRHLHFWPVIRRYIASKKIITIFKKNTAFTVTVPISTISAYCVHCFNYFLICHFFLLYINDFYHHAHLCF